MMNSAASVYPSHSYYGSSGEALPSSNHAAVGWPPQSHGGLSNVFDYYSYSVPVDYYSPSTTSHPHCVGTTSSTGTPSPHGFDRSRTEYWPSTADPLYAQLAGDSAYSYAMNGGKKKGIANNSKKERRRTISINGAFSNLRDCIPNVPKDTKLSKIKTLRLACGYIQYLMDALASEDPQPIQEFKADLSRKTPCRAEKRKCIEAEIAAAAERKSRGRSGWPQTIWAQDLKNDSSTSDYLPMKQFLSSEGQKTSFARVKSEMNCSAPRLDATDISDPSASCHSSLCEESSPTGSLG